MNTIRKILTTQVKSIEGKDRVLEFIGTTEMPDRENEVIKAEAWQTQQYIKNPVVQWAHRYNEPPIGKTLSIRQTLNKETIFEVEFAPKETYEFADTIFKLCKGGFLNATSVGFIPVEWENGKKMTDPRRTYTKVELLEISIVPVPSNPDALISARDTGLITVKEYQFITKPEETENFIHVPVSGEGGDKHKGHRIRNIEISAKDGISALYCGECKIVITYLFSKDSKYDWTMAKAEAWVKDHAKYIVISTTNSQNDTEVIQVSVQTDEVVLNSPRVAKVSQASIKDEIDYLMTMIDEVGLGDENKSSAQKLVRRITGSDMPVDYKAAIRDMVEPVIKLLDEHHDAHGKYYKGCRKALESMCGGKQESLEDYLREEIKRQMEVKQWLSN